MSLDFTNKFEVNAIHFDLFNDTSEEHPQQTADLVAGMLYSQFANGDTTVVLIVGDSRDFLDPQGSNKASSAKYLLWLRLLIE